MKTTIIDSVLITVMGVTMGILPCVSVPQTVLAQSSPTETPIQQNTKIIPIAIQKIRVSIPPGTLIGESRRGLFAIVDQQWHTENLSNSQRFIDKIAQALKKAGYTLSTDNIAQQATTSGSIFSNLNSEPPEKSTSPARFLVGGTITKVWMTATPDGWGGWSSDVDMKVTWEVYDTVQNKVILTQETYAVDKGGGITEDYFYTVMEMVAAKFFNSSEFNMAIKSSLRDFPATEPVQPQKPTGM